MVNAQGPSAPTVAAKKDKIVPPSPPAIIHDHDRGETFRRVGFLGEVCQHWVNTWKCLMNRADSLECTRWKTARASERR